MSRKKTDWKKAHEALLKKDAAYRRLFRTHGDLNFSPRAERTPFESLVRAIAHQQLHANAAEAILRRMLAHFPDEPFPKPEALKNFDPELLRACGFSRAKLTSILDIAEKTVSGIVPTSEEIVTLSDEEIVERLTQVRGVGEWTVQMMLIFQLGRLDIWPVDDFGVRAGHQAHFRSKEMPKPKALRELGDRWRPFRTLAALYLWKEADREKERKKLARREKKTVDTAKTKRTSSTKAKRDSRN